MYISSKFKSFIFIALCLTGFSTNAKEQGISAKQADEIISELKQIHALLEKGGAPSVRPNLITAAPQPDEKVQLKMTETNFLGKADAPLTVVEFTDYQCPFCRQYHIGAFDQVTKNFIDTGKVRYFSRDLALEFHEHAKRAANAVRCAGEQEHYWDYRHTVFVNAAKLTRDDLLNYARDMKLDMDNFTGCVDTDKYKDAIQKDSADAGTVGISGTPAFVVGKVDSNGVLQGAKFVGALPYAVFEKKLNEGLLKK